MGAVVYYPRLSSCNDLATSTKIFPNCMHFMPYSNPYNKIQAHYKWITSCWAFHAHYGPYVNGPYQNSLFMPITAH